MAKGVSKGMDLSGRVALVTGGAGGIGRAVAEQLAGLGAGVAVADIDAKGAEAVASELGADGAMGVGVDIADPESAEAMAAAVEGRFGRLDILVHSAGVGLVKGFLETTPEEWRRLIDIDLSGSFYCAQAAARMMKERGYGRIVLVSSISGLRGGTGRAAYGAAKAGVVGLVKVMALELGPHGITANALAPGPVETAMTADMHSDEARRVYHEKLPLDRYGTPEEMAFTAAFLSSEQAGYVTGQVVGVDGGFLAAGVIHGKTW